MLIMKNINYKIVFSSQYDNWNEFNLSMQFGVLLNLYVALTILLVAKPLYNNN